MLPNHHLFLSLFLDFVRLSNSITDDQTYNPTEERIDLRFIDFIITLLNLFLKKKFGHGFMQFLHVFKASFFLKRNHLNVLNELSPQFCPVPMIPNQYHFIVADF